MLRIDETVQKQQLENLHEVKASRDAAKVKAALDAVRTASTSGGEPDARRSSKPPRPTAPQQEICDVLRETMGTYTDPGGVLKCPRMSACYPHAD